jgi:prepilin-type processing-associated H-X9-DG protein
MIYLHLYALDNNDWIPPNPDSVLWASYIRRPIPGWVSGPEIGGCANLAFLTDPNNAKLAPYTRAQISLYKCPADSGIWLGIPWDPTLHQGRLRSYSMNYTVGAPYGYGSDVNGGFTFWPDPPRDRSRFATMKHPGPAKLIVMVEEDEHTIVTPAFGQTDEFGVADQNTGFESFQQRAVASRHGQTASFAFADGHGELHRWRNFPPAGNSPHSRREYWPRWPDYFDSPYRPKKILETADLYWLMRNLGSHDMPYADTYSMP